MSMAKLYRIQNRATKEWRQAWADSAQAACQSVGWQIGDCYVETMEERCKGWYWLGFAVGKEVGKMEAQSEKQT